ncbi:tyrosine-type recombinase/integrase [Hydrogenovibrio marinus]|uniref:Tyr recombinase domain-containing protein n=1 Tax=Hydrogenovibrio marinus TaxID=28885 RepID=A0A066ZLB9_HYDMR|nr:tyrosine-type recombinase/integrase [Hydrogenovibrio marinus]KDN94603.1 hypothetical protein EI16_11910 [Hydrogenovibrio marinus]
MSDALEGQLVEVDQPGELIRSFDGGRSRINPAEAYIRLLESDQSKITMTSYLKHVIWIAAHVSGKKLLDPKGSPIKKKDVAKYVTLDMMFWPNLTKLRINEVLQYLATKQKSKIATRQAYLAAMKGVMREAEELGYIDEKQLLSILKLSIKGRSKPKIRTLSLDEIIELFGSLANDAIGTRDTAIMAILLGGGLRRAEVAGLTMDQVMFHEQGFHVTGKGNKERTVYLNDNNWQKFMAYMNDVRGSEETILVTDKHDPDKQIEVPAPVFGRFWKNGDFDISKPLTPQAVYYILQRLTASIPQFNKLKPHDLRKTFATTLVNNGTPLTVVRDLLGHSSVKTTEIYVGVREQQLKDAARAINY